MHLTGGVSEAEESSGDDGDGIFLIVDVGDGRMCIDVISEGLVSDLSIRSQQELKKEGDSLGIEELFLNESGKQAKGGV